MGIFPVVFIYTLWLRNIGVYGLENLSEEYVLSFLPNKGEIDSFSIEYYENLLNETHNFESVLIEKRGSDSIDLFIILKEKGEFFISPLTGLTPKDKYTIGVEVGDRFFLRSEQRLELQAYFLNMKRGEILWMSYRKKLHPFLRAGYIQYQHPGGFTFREIPVLIGLYYEQKPFISFVSLGESFIKISEKEKNSIVRFSGGFKIFHSFHRHLFNFTTDFYPLGENFFSGLVEFCLFLPFGGWVLIPNIRFILQGPSVPSYRKLYWGGYRNIRSYPFGTFTGNNGQVYELGLLYQILPQINETPGLGIILFTEMGNTFNNYGEWRNNKLYKGGGAGLRFTFPHAQSMELFVAFNEEKKWRFGFSIENPYNTFIFHNEKN